MPISLKKKESKEKALKESNKIWRKAKIFEGKQKFLKGSKKKKKMLESKKIFEGK